MLEDVRRWYPDLCPSANEQPEVRWRCMSGAHQDRVLQHYELPRRLHRVRQELVQAVQVFQPDTMQSTGQVWVLQASVLVSAGHAAPAHFLPRVTERAEVRMPLPHTFEHRPSAPQLLTVQSCYRQQYRRRKAQCCTRARR